MIEGQPIACFHPFIDTTTGLVAGVEVLGRLRQADGELLSVGTLFAARGIRPTALRQLDRQIRDDALARLPEAPRDWFLSLNISPRWISRLRPDQPLPSLQQLQENGISPRRVIFEISEQGSGSPQLPEVVARYRQAGARIAIDDFGSGYSQLDRVLDLQPDILKLDMRLFQQAARGGPSGDVVRALAQMAEKTGCWIIAEGIETEEELDFALECGARYVQGFLFARPSLELPASNAFQALFARLRERFVQRKMKERANLSELRRQLAELMEKLRPWAESGAILSSLPDPEFCPRVLRIYQCDLQGTQTSPNLEWNGLFWKEDRRYIGHNWSWRPYFYQLLADGWEQRRLTLSGAYRDATTNQHCMTGGLFIDQGKRLLLIDIDAEGL